MRILALVIIILISLHVVADELTLYGGVESGLGQAWEMVYDTYTKVDSEGNHVPYTLSQLMWYHEYPVFVTGGFNYELKQIYFAMDVEALVYSGSGFMEDRDWKGLLPGYENVNVDETVETHYSYHGLYIDSFYKMSGEIGFLSIKNDFVSLKLGIGAMFSFVQFKDDPIYKEHTSEGSAVIKDDKKDLTEYEKAIYYSMAGFSPFLGWSLEFDFSPFKIGIENKAFVFSYLAARDYHFYYTSGFLAGRYDDLFEYNRFGGMLKASIAYFFNDSNGIRLTAEINGFFPVTGHTFAYPTPTGADFPPPTVFVDGAGNSELNYRFGLEYVLKIEL